MRKDLRARRIADERAMRLLQDELSDARAALRAAYGRFNAAAEPELIDACIYEINAAQARCGYFLRQIREAGAAAFSRAGKEHAACL